MEFIADELAQYCENHTSPESKLLHDLNRQTHLKVLQPRMLSGHLQGRFLSLIAQLMHPKLILEIGTYTGYSASCFLEGLNADGKLITIDNNPELAPIVKQYLLEHPKGNLVEFRVGNALDIIPSVPNEIDLVFIDADKPNYLNYFNAVLDKVKIGGLILADNVLWSGKVIEEVKANDKSTNAILEFNQKIQENNRVENVLLPIRDGIMAIRKIS